MAEALRRSTRLAKPRVDPDFIYELESLATRERISKTQHHSSSTDCSSPTRATFANGKPTKAYLHWSDINLPLTQDTEGTYNHLSKDNPVFSEDNQYFSDPTSSAVTKVAAKPLNRNTEERSVLVNNNRTSSTRLDFLDSFLSVSTSEHLNSSDMSELDLDSCICGECENCIKMLNQGEKQTLATSSVGTNQVAYNPSSSLCNGAGTRGGGSRTYSGDISETLDAIRAAFDMQM